MKRDLVTFSQQHNIKPADPTTFFTSKSDDKRKVNKDEAAAGD
jgi:hypothetical protein